MDDFEFLTPLDTRLEREYKSTTTLESTTNLSSVSYANPASTRSKDSTTEEDAHSCQESKEFLVPKGFDSILFLPIVDAVFRPNNLKRELVVKVNLTELTKALIIAAGSVDNLFAVVGNYAKGLCLLLSYKLKYLSADFSVYSKRLVGPSLTLPAKAEHSKYYESDDEAEYKHRRRNRKRKIRDTESVSTIQDCTENYQSELVPIERLEMLRVMNLGLAGNDLFFMNNEVSPVLKDYLSEMNISSKISADKDWLSFDDLRMLSSPFKLNAYSFTPNFDEATVAASSEVSFSTNYDIDWSLRNDPLNYNSSYYQKYFTSEANEYDTALALEDENPRRRRKSTTLRLYDVDLVRAEIKYDRRPNKYKPKKRYVQQRRPSLSENRTDRVQAPPQVDVKQKTLDQMFDQYFTSVVDKPGFGAGNQVPVPVIAGALNPRELNLVDAMKEKERTMPPLVREVEGKASRGQNEAKNAEAGQGGTKPFARDEKVHETTFQESTDGFGTIDILNWLRETFRKSDFNSIRFDSLTKGLKAGKVSVVFLRVLILANSNFVSISNDKEAINIAPAERFWEPVNTRLSLPVGS